jgi:glycosyltransferase involved in cell wall biosynthesis
VHTSDAAPPRREKLAPFRLPREEPSNVARLLCTRKIAPVYDCTAIVDALRLLQQRGVPFSFRFAAGGPDEPALRECVTSAGLEEKVTFNGGYTQKELPELLRAHDIYVSASRWDGTSLSLLEAMAAGIYPVVSDIIANRAWLTEEGEAEFFEVGNARQLADGLERAIKNPARRKAAAETLGRRVREEGDRVTNMQRLADAYERLLATRRK